MWMTCVMISKLLGVVIFLKINHLKQLLMSSYLMEITIHLTINKMVYSSKNLCNSTSTTHVQEIHCDLKCVHQLFLLYLYLVTFNAKCLCIYLVRSTILLHPSYFAWFHTKKSPLSLRHNLDQGHPFEVRNQISNSKFKVCNKL